MKTKTQIKAQITHLREMRDGYKYLYQHRFTEIINAQIRTLEWALGYKTPVYYWCQGCQRPHRNLVCPTCGNGTLAKTDKEE